MMCIGTWLEGGDRMGMDEDGAIRYFWKRKKFWEVHFRNVSAQEPKFKEVFMDNGYYPLFKSMKTLVEIGYNAHRQSGPYSADGGRALCVYGLCDGLHESVSAAGRG